MKKRRTRLFSACGTSALTIYNDLALCLVKIHDDFADLRHENAAGQRILDADYGRDDGGLHLGALKTQVCVDHLAVDQLEVFAVAKGLRADDPAVFKGEVFAVPRQILVFLSKPVHMVARRA